MSTGQGTPAKHPGVRQLNQHHSHVCTAMASHVLIPYVTAGKELGTRLQTSEAQDSAEDDIPRTCHTFNHVTPFTGECTHLKITLDIHQCMQKILDIVDRSYPRVMCVMNDSEKTQLLSFVCLDTSST